MSTADPSVFARIARREIPATIVAETDTVLAIEDIAPKAPVHVLVFPKTDAYATVADLARADPALLAEVVAMTQQVADARAGGQYRLVFNSGEAAGQTVFHVHAHVLASDPDSGPLQEGSLAG